MWRSDYDNFWQKCYPESKKLDDALCSHCTYLVLQHCTGALCMQHSPAAALSTAFLLNHAPLQQRRAERIDYKI